MHRARSDLIPPPPPTHPPTYPDQDPDPPTPQLSPPLAPHYNINNKTNLATSAARCATRLSWSGSASYPVLRKLAAERVEALRMPLIYLRMSLLY